MSIPLLCYWNASAQIFRTSLLLHELCRVETIMPSGCVGCRMSFLKFSTLAFPPRALANIPLITYDCGVIEYSDHHLAPCKGKVEK
eukprot:16795-Pelagomonas_calceolata.AAC.15